MVNPFSALRDKIFLKLYLSQTISLLGDAFTWVGIALLAFQFGGNHSAAILSTALTLRVTAFILFGPWWGIEPFNFCDNNFLFLSQKHIAKSCKRK